MLVATVGVCSSLIYSLRDDVTAIVQQLPTAAQKLRESFRAGRTEIPNPVAQMQKAATELGKAAVEATGTPVVPRGVVRVQVEEPVINVPDYLWWGSIGAAAFAAQLTLVLFPDGDQDDLRSRRAAQAGRRVTRRVREIQPQRHRVHRDK